MRTFLLLAAVGVMLSGCGTFTDFGWDLAHQ